MAALLLRRTYPDLKKPGARKAENADFAVAIKKGKAQANGWLAMCFSSCASSNVTAIIWYEKTRRGLDT